MDDRLADVLKSGAWFSASLAAGAVLKTYPQVLPLALRPAAVACVSIWCGVTGSVFMVRMLRLH